MATHNTFPDDQLFRTKPEQYSDAYIEHLLEQYKLYVQSHEKISERREGSNKFFLALNSAVVAAIAFLWETTVSNDFLVFCISLAAVAICVFWYRSIRSYDNLNTGKFKVIHAIEKRLPLALYETEWRVLGEGKDPDLYKPISHLERSIPVAFGCLYILIAVVRISGG